MFLYHSLRSFYKALHLNAIPENVGRNSQVISVHYGPGGDEYSLEEEEREKVQETVAAWVGLYHMFPSATVHFYV